MFFFRNTASSATNVVHLSKEDFHHCAPEEPVRITLTFKDLSPEAMEELKLYVRHERLTITAKADWNEAVGSAEVKQYGLRMVMKAFAPYFEGVEKGLKAPELKVIYDQIRENFPDLPNATTGPAREKALREYEESKPKLCELLESQNQFFGFTKGANLLGKYVQWIYVPAVKDASSEQDENSKTALGQLLERTIRAKVKFKESISTLRKNLEEEYQKIIAAEQDVLDDLQASMQSRLREWANAGASLQLGWHYDPNKSLVVNEPIARARIGEDSFIGEVARLGHGMQRSFLVTLLHELAVNNTAAGPTLILGFEEPELYQHPPQAQHMASVLESLASTTEGNAQIIISTHSPYFVSSRGFECIRMVRKHRKDKCSLVTRTTYSKLEKLLADALGVEAESPSVTMAQLEQVMQPSLRELFFTRFAIFVEGQEDVAFVATHLHLINRWIEFRRLGCHFIMAGGKTNLSRPVAIANELCIRNVVVFDADGDDKNNKKGHTRDNGCLLTLCSAKDVEVFPNEIVWRKQVVVWPKRIADTIRDELTDNVWKEAELAARERHNIVTSSIKPKNSFLVAATLEELDRRGVRSQTLTKLCDHILTGASEAEV